MIKKCNQHLTNSVVSIKQLISWKTFMDPEINANRHMIKKNLFTLAITSNNSDEGFAFKVNSHFFLRLTNKFSP